METVNPTTPPAQPDAAHATPPLRYYVLERGHAYAENTLHECATEEERNLLTQKLIFGESAGGPDELDMWTKYAEELNNTGWIEFEGDPGLEWFAAMPNETSSLRAELAQAKEEVERLGVVLTDISKQRLGDEMTGDEWNSSDFESGYDACIQAARNALARKDGPK